MVSLNLFDTPSLIVFIKSLTVEKFKFNDKLTDELCQLVTETEDNKLRDVIALKLADLANPKVVPFLIQALEKLKKSKYNSTIIYACSEYDCGNDINLFVDIMLENVDVSYMDSIYVIQAIQNPISEIDKRIALKKIDDYLQVENDIEKKANVKECREIIENIKSHSA